MRPLSSSQDRASPEANQQGVWRGRRQTRHTHTLAAAVVMETEWHYRVCVFASCGCVCPSLLVEWRGCGTEIGSALMSGALGVSRACF
jgi:hypothetical protein